MLRKLSLSVALVLAAASAYAADPLKVGEPAPDFKGVDAVSGNEFSLADCKDAKATVVVFTCNRCPVAVAYEDRFAEFAKTYAEKGVKFVAIDCNKDEISAMKQRAEEKGFGFPYVADQSQASAVAYGAKVTPHVFLLDGSQKVQYIGAFDNKVEEPTENYLVNAVDAVLAGETPETQTTKAFGCGIPLRRN